MVLVVPQKRKVSLAYRLQDMRIWMLEGQPASVKETFNMNHSVRSKKEGAQAANSLLVVVLTTNYEEINWGRRKETAQL